ncbi:MAG: hypothetical protein GXY07_08130 [Candidatus Hydrogenedentes bacterium]|nr:hypothetical protein [Candidatus Hydrogenedentota bacterium]
MPLFEHRMQFAQSTKEGKNIPIPPAQSLHVLGPVLQVVVSPTEEHIRALNQRGELPPQPVTGLALIDTGATATAVDEEVCRKLGLKPTGSMKTAHAGGPEERACYPIAISFPNTPFPAISTPTAMSVNLQFGKTPYILLFGRDLLVRIKFVYNGPAGRFEMAY